MSESHLTVQDHQLSADIYQETHMGSLVSDTPWSEITATLEILDTGRLTRSHLSWLRANRDYAEKVMNFMRGEGLESYSHYEGRKAFGKNFFGIMEWFEHFKYSPELSVQDLANIQNFPWIDLAEEPCPFTPKKKICETHFAYLGLDKMFGATYNLERVIASQGLRSKGGTSLIELAVNSKLSKTQAWWTRTPKVRWYLSPIGTNLYQQYAELDVQSKIMPGEYVIVKAIENLQMNVLFTASQQKKIDDCLSYAIVTEEPIDKHPVVFRKEGESISLTPYSKDLLGRAKYALTRKPTAHVR